MSAGAAAILGVWAFAAVAWWSPGTSSAGMWIALGAALIVTGWAL